MHRFFSGEATVREEKAILSWLTENPENPKELIRERKIFDTILLTDESRLGVERKKFLSGVPRWAKELVRTAAILVLAIGVGYYFLHKQADETAGLSTTVTVPAGQRVNITLPDGTNVWLNSLSEISYPISFTGKERKVKLTGEAFFDVTHDPDKPFIVGTGQYDIRVLGTKFNVHSAPARGEFSTSVLEGRVMVTDCNNPDNRILLLPQQEVRYAGHRLMVQEIYDTDVFRWREGLICFREASLQSLLERFSYSYDVKIVFRSEDLPGNVLGGKLRVSDGIFHALRVLQRDARFTWEWNESENIIYISSSK